MTDAQLIQLWNLLFPDNDSREISEQDLRDGLIALLNTLSTRIGNLPNLNTVIKTSIVNAINELVYKYDLLAERVAPQFGEADPNDVPPPSSWDYASIYIQQEVIEGDAYDIGFWIYTGVEGVGWLNLISLIKPIYEGTDNPNITPPNGFDNNNGAKGSLYYQRIFATQGTVDSGFWIYVSPVTKWINLMAKEIIFVSDLPTNGVSNTLYVRTSDNTMHRFQNSSFPPSWVQLTDSYKVMENGARMLIRRKPGNPVSASLNAGDRILLGWKDGTFVTEAEYVSGTDNLWASYTPITVSGDPW